MKLYNFAFILARVILILFLLALLSITSLAQTAQSFNTTISTVGASAIQLQGTVPAGNSLSFGIGGYGSGCYTCTAPQHGTITYADSSTGVVVYKPAANYTGPDFFGFIVYATPTGGGAATISAQATVSITVTNAKTQVQSALLNPDGSPRSGKVTWILTQPVQSPDGLIAASSTVSAALDGAGKFDVSIYPSTALSPQAYYQVWFADAATLRRELIGIYEIPASAVTITDLSPYKVTDTNLAARYTFASAAMVSAMLANINIGSNDYDVRKYGATCNGTTSDQAAFDNTYAAAAATHGTIVIPSATCVGNLKISTYGITVKGSGSQSSFIKSLDNTKAAIEIDASLVNTHSIRIEGVGLIGNGSGANNHGIYVHGANYANNLVVRDVNISGFTGRGIYDLASFTAVYENVMISQPAGGDNNFEILGGSDLTLRQCYATTVGANKAAYRIYAGAVSFIGCNGINSGTNASWAILGRRTDEDGVDSYVRATFISTNIEDFTKYPVRFKTGSFGNFIATSIVAPASGTVEPLTYDFVTSNQTGIFDAASSIQTQGATWNGGYSVKSSGAPFAQIGHANLTQYFDTNVGAATNLPAQTYTLRPGTTDYLQTTNLARIDTLYTKGQTAYVADDNSPALEVSGYKFGSGSPLPNPQSIFRVRSSVGNVLSLQALNNESLILGSGGRPPSATEGFLYLPTMAGQPTGTPTDFSGRAPLQIDTTNGKLWAYYSGAWNSLTGTGGGGTVTTTGSPASGQFALMAGGSSITSSGNFTFTDSASLAVSNVGNSSAGVANRGFLNLYGFSSSSSTAFPQFAFNSGRGTAASKSATQSGDRLGQIWFYGYGTSATDGVMVQGVARSTWTSSNAESALEIYTAKNGTLNSALTAAFSLDASNNSVLNLYGSPTTAKAGLRYNNTSALLEGSHNGTNFYRAAFLGGTPGAAGNYAKFDVNGNLVEGDLAVNSSINNYTGTAGGLSTAFGGTFAANGGTVSLTSTTETTLLNVTGWSTTTLPANYLTVGRQINFEGGGFYSTSGSGTTPTVRLKLGGTTIVTGGNTPLSPSITNAPFRIRATLVVISAGASGTVHVYGGLEWFDPGSSLWVVTPLVTTSAQTLDTTTTRTIDLTLAWSNSGNTATLTGLSFRN